jgi:NADPH-dependent 2,4-dienoyl-CoA reductase/sulfur reductase-like enzyme
MTRYVIVGTGVAGIAAAQAIRSVDTTGEIRFVSDDPHGYYSRPGLAYYLTGELEEKHLYAFKPEDYDQLKAGFIRETAMRILPETRELELSNQARLPFDKLLLGTGASTLRINLPGANLQGVVKLDHMEDARRIVALSKKTWTAVVVGGGITALELAEGLAARRVKVHYLVRGDRYWGNVLDETESRIVENRLKEEKIQVHHKTELAEILGKNGKIVGVRTTSGKQIKCDMLAYAIGISPRIELAKSAGVNFERGILVNEFMETNIPGIYAAGDVAQAFDPVSEKHVLDSLWSPAREQGNTAGLNMAGVRQRYARLPVFNVTRLAGLTTTIIGAVGGGRDADLAGIARGDSETWRNVPDAIIAQGGFDINRLRLMIGHHTLLGAVVMGDQKLSSALQALIRDQVDISPIRERLLQKDAPIADIVARFWREYAS